MNTRNIRLWLILALAGILVFAPSALAQSKGKNATTLAAVKTLDICEVTPPTDDAPAVWRYSGVISVWNEGAVDTIGLAIEDWIQNKVGSGKFENAYSVPIGPIIEIPAGTTREWATVFTYSYEDAPLEGDIRNVAKVTILNHSGSIDVPKGPEPKATWYGIVLPCDSLGCTRTQGYWKNHREDWPAGYAPDDEFYMSGRTWMAVLETAPAGDKYYILAHQYIAAMLNVASGAFMPDSVYEYLNLATSIFMLNAPPINAGYLAVWAGVLDVYNQGYHPAGPPHCKQE